MNHYQATIYYTVQEDSYLEGITGNILNSWEHTITATDLTDLRQTLEDMTYSKREDWGDEQINEYDDATEYSTSYISNERGENEVTTPAMIENWEKGGYRLFVTDCHILVSEITKTKATL